MLRLALVILTLGLSLQLAAPAAARDRAFIQIEAKANRAEAEERARAWATMFDDVRGFVLGTGWHVIVLGPFSQADAETRLLGLLRENLVPGDSFVSDGLSYGQSFWPPVDGAADAARPAAEPEPATVPALPDETPQEARQSEAALTQQDRETIQTALAWFGVYDRTVDGAFGAGTRAAMAAWQELMGETPTGVLNARQRATLVANYQAEKAALGLQTVNEAEAGIAVTLPTALLRFDHYEPPFVHFTASDGSEDLRVTLISQPGDRAALVALYDMLQSLRIMPLDGPRERRESSFTLRGESATLSSQAYAELSGGLIKGWIVTWNPQAGLPIDRILPAVESSFRGIGDRALDPGIMPMDDATRSGLLAGLEVRRPRLSASGFYIDAAGRVLTAADTVASCGRITLDGTTDAALALADPATGLAVLLPTSPLSPPAHAEFQLSPDRIGSEIAVAGYSYGAVLPAPVMTFGTLAATEGLDGQTGMKRLALDPLPGDAGGPVVDQTGAVLGMLLPQRVDAARILPAGVAFATAGRAIADTLQARGISLSQAARQGALPPEDLASQTAGMTVLVSCWD